MTNKAGFQLACLYQNKRGANTVHHLITFGNDFMA
jgi:hypothetical protein